MKEFNINELMLFIVGVVSALGGLCLIVQRSKCEDIDLCFLKCKRNVKAVIDSEKIKSGIAIPPTPVPRASEPEPETIPLP